MISEIQGVQSAYELHDWSTFWFDLEQYCPGNFVIPTKLFDFLVRGYTKYTCVYGILIAGDDGYPDSNLLYAANTLQMLLDKDCLTDCNRIKPVRDNLFGAWLNGASSEFTEFLGDTILGLKGYGLQNWKGQTEAQSKVITTEEVFHMVHQSGWAVTYPEQLGVDNYEGSIICREAARLACTNPGWYHPENICPNGGGFSPGNPAQMPLEGSCSDVNCDCVEFFHQAFLMSIGQKPGWFSEFMPETQAGMNAMLSQEFKTMIGDAYFGLPTQPFDQSAYSICDARAPALVCDVGSYIYPSITLILSLLSIKSFLI